ncbi:5'-methylthioadenosine/S-adenosylhomocysteine nucleosidase [Gemmata sp. SH-PL17]|uniref:caspase family protein n=1 Tax=Gemmata sp. SH-PL17 TaxID=1630693 RepID=UPI00078C6F5D|nr:caspase family protein [Gemmata sp. SH-PL17]AMV23994.1 5'-methylthioadenosine/S-adenosylhomocysteine nucleosidase [Gemmata sp. SH-PL17]
MLAASDIRGSVTFGILTVRSDEYTAVLEHFPNRETVKGRVFYEYSQQEAADGKRVGIAVARSLEQGPGAAHDLTRDLIEDLDPDWILVVGIAGGLPEDDYSLGDVLLASRIYDFSVSAEILDGEQHQREWSLGGGAVHPDVAAVLGAIPGWESKLKGWNKQTTVGMKKPVCEIPHDASSDRLYGPVDWRSKVQKSLARHFPESRKPRLPNYAVIPVGGGGILVKDPALITEWKQSARALGFVEMEAGGVYRAARRTEREYPVLVVRGLSDIVGFKRAGEWTSYACKTAASFAGAFVRSGIVTPKPLKYTQAQAKSPTVAAGKNDRAEQQGDNRAEHVVFIEFLLRGPIEEFNESNFRQALQTTTGLDVSSARIASIQKRSTLVRLEGDPEVLARIVAQFKASQDALHAFATTTGLTLIRWHVGSQQYELTVQSEGNSPHEAKQVTPQLLSSPSSDQKAHGLPPASGRTATFAKGRALVIGVANYPHVNKLPGSVLDDARDVADLLRSSDFCGYPPANVEVLLDAQATLNGIRESLTRLTQTSAPDETVVVYFSGHGGRIPSGEFLIPFDCNPRNIANTALSGAELTTFLSTIKAERLAILLDACHSSGTAELKSLDPAEGVKAGLSDAAYNLLAQGKGRVMMASCRADETSVVLGGMRNSLFTHHLLDALRGKASTENVVRVFDVFNYVSDKVPAQEKKQHPVFKAHNLETNFPLSLRAGGKALGGPEAPVPPAPRLIKLSGKAKLTLYAGLVTRWSALATYLDISLEDRAKFLQGHEPRQIFEWLEERNRLGELRGAFKDLGWPDLIEELDRHPQ